MKVHSHQIDLQGVGGQRGENIGSVPDKKAVHIHDDAEGRKVKGSKEGAIGVVDFGGEPFPD